MSGLALFSLKFPSLLQFDQGNKDPIIRHNLKSPFGVKKAPSDTYLREVLDKVNPRSLAGAFKQIFRLVQRGKVLERFQFLDQSYLLSVDGTGYFSSQEVYWDSCCQKKHRDGAVTYYHQLLSAVLVHPEESVVLPFAPEPLIQQDGVSKTAQNAHQLMKGGRARWKIENETFKTLKNHGHQFEHNFGHGKKNLSTIFASIMMLAFYVDQVQQTASKAFKRALAHLNHNKRTFWTRLRSAIPWLYLELGASFCSPGGGNRSPRQGCGQPLVPPF